MAVFQFSALSDGQSLVFNPNQGSPSRRRNITLI